MNLYHKRILNVILHNYMIFVHIKSYLILFSTVAWKVFVMTDPGEMLLSIIKLIIFFNQKFKTDFHPSSSFFFFIQQNILNALWKF